MNVTRRFYKELGNLFYAIAAADKKITEQEKKKLDDEVQFAWRHFDSSTDRFGTDRAFLIEFEFEAMEEEMTPAETAFRSFEEYFKENKSQIETSVRRQILNSATHIAESLRKINAAEHKYLDRLKKLMEI